MTTIFYIIGVVVVVLIVLGERRRIMSDSSRDVVALAVGVALLMVVWFAIGGGSYRLSPDMDKDAQPVGPHPVSAVGLKPG